MEHIEEAGIHSGDSCCTLPAHSLSERIQEELRNLSNRQGRIFEVTNRLAKGDNK